MAAGQPVSVRPPGAAEDLRVHRRADETRGQAIHHQGRQRGIHFAEWEPVSEKEAELTWSTGFVGFSISLSLPEKDGALHGVASTFADIPERPDTAKVKLIRIGC